MTWEMLFTLFVVLTMMVCLVKEVARPDLTVFIALIILLATGILTTEEAIAGFSNEGMLTVCLLFVVAGTLQKSGIMERVMYQLLKKNKEEKRSLSRLLIPVTGVSAFLNNTPIVATLTPIVRKWCMDHNISPSKFLIPLSFASILGGLLTLMGTSTNLVIHGLMLERGLEGYSLFTLTIYSLPACILGITYLVTLGYKLLPNYHHVDYTLKEKSDEYLIETIVEENYPFLETPIINKTVEEAGLRNLESVYLIAIIRKEEKIYPVHGGTIIRANDHLIFTGKISNIADIQDIKGLTLKADTKVNLDRLQNGQDRLMEVVISHQSSLVYQRIKDTGFRATYDAGVLAVHRDNVHIESKIGDIVLRPGDTLLLLTGNDFEKRTTYSNDFYFVSPVEDHPLVEKVNATRPLLTALIFTIMIILVSLDVLSMFKAMSMTVVLYLLFKIVSFHEAKEFVHFHVLLLIASSFGIGTALFKTGAADWIASYLIKLSIPLGDLGVYIFLYFITVVFTEIITNNAAAVFMFPIAVEAANQLGEDPLAFLVLITIGASASFLSPIGYQTNLIVYHPGGYKFVDFFKVGLPLSLIVMLSTIATVYWMGL
ncbi:SLC13 family permease [Radiobacillus kanasensis]|uniref:SLC13 family permease n=1 Tax=Radiobacillus kanasensis TaxID=2844358 RepID=UPI001E336C75|nr:SLC13 family permease [Radiobacillus kanasensis]UFT98046.1 SLC13 family permease [Radiobacillus kanasensis]